MPTYQYACPDCGASFETVQKFTDKPLKKCPACGKAKIHRVVGRIAVAFKGSGFYINDSKGSGASSSPAGKADDAKPTAESGSAADAGAKGDSTAADKSAGSDTSTASTAATTTEAASSTSAATGSSSKGEAKSAKSGSKRKKSDG
jgi:putative FmdB family regulatory protein